jgi:hypothetical protein
MNLFMVPGFCFTIIRPLLDIFCYIYMLYAFVFKFIHVYIKMEMIRSL